MEKSTKPNTFKFRPDQQLLLGSKEKDDDDRKKRKSKRREKRDDRKRKNEANIGEEEHTGHAPSDRKNTSRLHRWFIKNLRIRKVKDVVKKVDEGEDISTARRGRSGTIITVREEIMVEEGKRRHQKTDFQILEMQYPEDGSYGKVCTLCFILCHKDSDDIIFLLLTVYIGMGSGLSRKNRHYAHT